MKLYRVHLIAVLLLCPALAHGLPEWVSKSDYTRVFALDEADTAASWLLHPVYGLPGSVGLLETPMEALPEPAGLSAVPGAFVFRGLEATQRRNLPASAVRLGQAPLSVEMWVNDHMSGEVGLVLSARTWDPRQEPLWKLTYWSVGYASRAMEFGLTPAEGGPVLVPYANKEKDGFKEYWRHLVGVWDGKTLRLYVNGALRGEQPAAATAAPLDDLFLELSGYFESEPYMELGNMVRRVRLHDRVLQQPEIEERFAVLCNEVEKGIVFPGSFHLNAGPYISYASEERASVVFETDRPVEGTVQWGTQVPLEHGMDVPGEGLIREFTLEGLEADTPYFYQINLRDASGAALATPLLSFRTAMPAGEPFRFGVIGDTETRPQVNQKICRNIWNERVSFVVNLGDLTDGGKEHAKFQWNYEYFVGMTPFASRVPLMAVPGNGESDLYWYKRYHALPGEESPYQFTWGDAAFFMLDSNPRREEFAPGGRQYVWLEAALKASRARWKFVCMHHAPYTSEENDYGNSWNTVSRLGDLDVRQIVPLLEANGVDMVMFGHLHLYERTRPMRLGKVEDGGIIYLLSGGAGGNLEDFAPNPAPFTVKTHRGHHYCTVDLRPDACTIRMYDLEGALRDQFELHK